MPYVTGDVGIKAALVDPVAPRMDEAPSPALLRYRSRMLGVGRGPAWTSLVERLCECPLVSGSAGLNAEGMAALSGDNHEDYCPARLADDAYEPLRDEILAVIGSEVGSVYSFPADRYVVSLIVTYDDSRWTDVQSGLENIHAPATAAAAALDLTRDSGSRSTIWHVFDRRTKTMHKLAQREFESA